METAGLRRVTAGLLMLFVSFAMAEENRYGAISYSTLSGYYGYANNHDSREEAQLRARSVCEVLSGKDQCENSLWFRDACGAIAIGLDKGYGTAWDLQKDQAEEEALANCAQWDQSCLIARSVCVGDVPVVKEPASLHVATDEPRIQQIDPLAEQIGIEIQSDVLQPMGDRLTNAISFPVGDEGENLLLIGFIIIMLLLYIPIKFILNWVAHTKPSSLLEHKTPADLKILQRQREVRGVREVMIQRISAKAARESRQRGESRKPFQKNRPPLSRKPRLNVVVDMVRERRQMREKGFNQ